MIPNKRAKVLITGIIIILCNCLISNYLVINWATVIWSDMEAYYQWLPSFFIKHNVLQQPYAFILPDGTPFNRYTYGVAFLTMPFFLLIHLYQLISHNPATGYGASYGFSIVLAGVTYCFLGLYFLFLFLRRSFGKRAVIITLVCIFLGTNLFYYTIGEPGMSHVFSFFLFSWLIYASPAFIKDPRLRNTLAVAVPFAIAVLIRPTNLLMGLFLLLYEVGSLKDLKIRILLFIKKPRVILIFLMVFIIFWVPQMFYWHATTGEWIVYSYKYSVAGLETFRYWANPQIPKVLFGARSGWLLYSPIMILSLTGMILILVKNTHHAWAVLILFLCILYLNSSWQAYTFACGFGYRSFVEYYPVLAIPAAFMVDKILGLTHKWLIPLILYVFLALIFANIRMTFLYQAHHCWDGKNWGIKQYKMVWSHVFFIEDPEDSYPPYEN
jgi:hypothetical protein